MSNRNMLVGPLNDSTMIGTDMVPTIRIINDQNEPNRAIYAVDSTGKITKETSFFTQLIEYGGVTGGMCNALGGNNYDTSRITEIAGTQFLANPTATPWVGSTPSSIYQSTVSNLNINYPFPFMQRRVKCIITVAQTGYYAMTNLQFIVPNNVGTNYLPSSPSAFPYYSTQYPFSILKIGEGVETSSTYPEISNN